MSATSSERDFQEEKEEANVRKRGGFVEWSKTPFAFLLGAALVLAGVVRDHESSLKHCVDAGGSFDRAYGNCEMPGGATK